MPTILCTTIEELIANFKIRKTVFIDEQQVSYEDEYDLIDDQGFLFVHKENDHYTSCARAFIYDNYAKIGRVATLPKWRGLGLCQQMMFNIENFLKTKGVNKIILDAQVSAIPFYQKCGYHSFGEYFYDANILHQKMEKDL